MPLREYVARFRGQETEGGTDHGGCARAHEEERGGYRDGDAREGEGCARARAGNVGYLRGWVIKPLNPKSPFPKYQVPNPKSQIPNPKSQILLFNPQTLNPRPQTPTPNHSLLDPLYPKALNPKPSTRWVYERDSASLVRDVDIPPFAFDWFSKLPSKDDPCFRWIFLGPGGSKTPLHVDPCLTHAWLAQVYPETLGLEPSAENCLISRAWLAQVYPETLGLEPSAENCLISRAWLAQIIGSKRFVLYPPSDLSHLFDAKGQAVDIRDPDRCETRHPKP
jgi:hypothetical protein